DAKTRAQDALAETHGLLAETEQGLRALPSLASLEAELAAAQARTAELRLAVSERRTELIALEHEHRSRSERTAAIAVEAERWRARSQSAEAQITAIGERIQHAEGERARLAPIPAVLAGKRRQLLDMLVAAEAERRLAGDRLATAE